MQTNLFAFRGKYCWKFLCNLFDLLMTHWKMGENYGLPIMFFVNKKELLEIRGRLILLTFYRYVFICPNEIHNRYIHTICRSEICLFLLFSFSFRLVWRLCYWHFHKTLHCDNMRNCFSSYSVCGSPQVREAEWWLTQYLYYVRLWSSFHSYAISRKKCESRVFLRWDSAHLVFVSIPPQSVR